MRTPIFDFDFDFCKNFPGFSKKRSGLLPFFAKVKIKIELKKVPLSGPPRSTFAKVDHFDFCKNRLLQKSNFDFGKSETFLL